jgi:hypothetical protein
MLRSICQDHLLSQLVCRIHLLCQCFLDAHETRVSIRPRGALRELRKISELVSGLSVMQEQCQEMLSLCLDKSITLGDAPFLDGLEGQTGCAVIEGPCRGVLRTNDPQARHRISERLHEVALHRLTKL